MGGRTIYGKIQKITSDSSVLREPLKIAWHSPARHSWRSSSWVGPWDIPIRPSPIVRCSFAFSVSGAHCPSCMEPTENNGSHSS